MQKLLHEDPTQNEKQLAERLNASLVAICERLHFMGKIQKMRRWMPQELNDRQLEFRTIVSDMLLQMYERKSFLIQENQSKNC